MIEDFELEQLIHEEEALLQSKAKWDEEFGGAQNFISNVLDKCDQLNGIFINVYRTIECYDHCFIGLEYLDGEGIEYMESYSFLHLSMALNAALVLPVRQSEHRDNEYSLSIAVDNMDLAKGDFWDKDEEPGFILALKLKVVPFKVHGE